MPCHPHRNVLYYRPLQQEMLHDIPFQRRVQNQFLTANSTPKKWLYRCQSNNCIQHYSRALFYDIPELRCSFTTYLGPFIEQEYRKKESVPNNNKTHGREDILVEGNRYSMHEVEILKNRAKINTFLSLEIRTQIFLLNRPAVVVVHYYFLLYYFK